MWRRINTGRKELDRSSYPLPFKRRGASSADCRSRLPKPKRRVMGLCKQKLSEASWGGVILRGRTQRVRSEW